MRSFINEQLLVIQWRKKINGSPVCNPNKFSDETKYLQEENNTKNCIIKTLFENQKNIQNSPDWRTLDIDQNKPESSHPSILPKKTSSNMKPPSSNLITTSNSFALLSENIKNSLDANNVISIEDSNAESYSNKGNKPNNTSISTEKSKL